jgi:two-component system, chemotaxis family, response regulator Rcp1
MIIEDNPVDVELLKISFEESRWPVETAVVTDGEKATEILREGIADPDVRPHLIILDLNLPCREGADVLRDIRSGELAYLPVVILSSSPEDVIHSKLSAAGVIANAHFTKPLGIDEFVALAADIRHWYEDRVNPDDAHDQ